MLVTSSPKEISVIDENPRNQDPMVGQFKETDDMLLQPLKALFPMLVTLFPIVTDVRLVHSLKHVSPMVVTLFGMVMDARLLHW